MTSAAILVATWEKLGVRDATISPGSRSTPLALALSESDAITVHVLLDERSSGFFALGLSKISLRPTVVVTTSGTAATELRPAVTEAALSSIPLIVCTSDRPFELHGVGAPQTVDQELLFRDVVLRCFLLESPSPHNVAAWSSVGSQSFAAAMHLPGGRGPVHVNVPFREPLFDGPVSRESVASIAVSQMHSVRGTEDLERLEKILSVGPRGLVMVGATEEILSADLNRIARSLGWPILCDPRSRLHCDPALTVVHGDLILRSPQYHEQLRPDVILRIGESFSSKVIAQYLTETSSLRGGPTEIVSWAPSGRFYDPEGVASLVSVIDVNGTLAVLADMAESLKKVPSAFLSLWVELDNAVEDFLSREFALSAPLDDPATAFHLLRELDERDLLFVSSSMPIRDVEWFGSKASRRPLVVANRGANGIDGVVSSYFGARRAWENLASDALSVLLLGDLAYLYDIGSLGFGEGRRGRGLIVVNDNDGGGIFSFLPQRSVVSTSRFEQVFGTPHGQDLEAITRGFGYEVTTVSTAAELSREVEIARRGETTRVVLQRSSRDGNVIRHEALYDRVRGVVTEAFATAHRNRVDSST
jgi:2-succinyl-5-enolpyruvyl-6-hydroxy-3-cyclohexene-1-carboxylate synthase